VQTSSHKCGSRYEKLCIAHLEEKELAPDTSQMGHYIDIKELLANMFGGVTKYMGMIFIFCRWYNVNNHQPFYFARKVFFFFFYSLWSYSLKGNTFFLVQQQNLLGCGIWRKNPIQFGQCDFCPSTSVGKYMKNRLQGHKNTCCVYSSTLSSQEGTSLVKVIYDISHISLHISPSVSQPWFPGAIYKDIYDIHQKSKCI